MWKKSFFVLGISFFLLTSATSQSNIHSTCDFLKGLSPNPDMQCGKIEVPENHNNPDGKKIQIAYTILKSKNKNSNAFPMIYFSGGPGGASLIPWSIERWLQSPLREQRDIILFDQRGIGQSSALPNMEKEFFQMMASDLTALEEQEAMNQLLVDQKTKCKQSGIDLRNYNSFQNARDVGVLMKELAYSRYNLYGVSYGTRLARIVQDMFPQNINSVIHNSPAPLTGDFLIGRLESYSRALQKIFTYCENDAQCKAQYPALKETYLTSIKRLDEQPFEMEYNGMPFVVNAQDALYLLRRKLYGNDSRSSVPALIKAFEERKKGLIEEVIKFEFLFTDFYNSTMWLAVERYEMFNEKYTPEVIEKIYEHSPLLPVRLGIFTSAYIASKNLHDARIPEAKKQFKISKVPSLITVNQYDPVTPPAYGYIFKERLPNAYLFVLDEGGHGGGDVVCRTRVMIDFMNNPRKKLDASCLNVYKE